MEPSIQPQVASKGRRLALWVGVLGAPAVWAVQLQAGYSFAPQVGSERGHLIFHVITAVGLVMVIIAALVSLRDWRAANGGSPDEPVGGPLGRTRFLGALGLIVSVLFALVILAQGIAGFFFDGCWN